MPNGGGADRRAEIRIHASGFARGASNPKPNLDIPNRNCRTIGTLLQEAERAEPEHPAAGCNVPFQAALAPSRHSALAPSPAAWRGKSKKVNVQQIRRSKQ